MYMYNVLFVFDNTDKSWNFSILIFSIIQYLQNKSQKLSRVCRYVLGWSHLEINKTIYHQNTFLLYPGNHCNEKLKSIWKSSNVFTIFCNYNFSYNRWCSFLEREAIQFTYM